MRIVTRLTSLTISALALWLPAPAPASTYLVKPDGTGDYATIQDAVDAAGDGDEILLAAGTFQGTGNHEVDFSGKAITIRSQDGIPDLCVIDADPHIGGFSGLNGFLFVSGEGASSVLEGVRIVNAEDGAYDIGTPEGAIHVDNGSSPVLRNLLIESNYLKEGWGSAVYVAGGGVTLEDCAIRSNTGGGVTLYSATGTLTGCTIEANSTAESSGGGIRAWASQVTLESCRINRNSSYGQDFANPQGGGGIYLWGGSLSATDCEILENTSTDRAGGVFLGGGATVSLDRVTIAGNRSPTGGGIYGGAFTGTFDTSILWGNCTTSSGADAYLEAGAALTAACSDVDPAQIAGPGTLVLGTGSVSLDPLFCVPRLCGDPLTVQGIYSLQKASPLINLPGCGTLGAPQPQCDISIAPTSWGKIKGGYH